MLIKKLFFSDIFIVDQLPNQSDQTAIIDEQKDKLNEKRLSDSEVPIVDQSNLEQTPEINISPPEINPELINNPSFQSTSEAEGTEEADLQTLKKDNEKKKICNYPDIILAEFVYEYFNGVERNFGYTDAPITPEKNLFVINNELYRPDSIQYIYDENTGGLKHVIIKELLLTDPNLPSGQKPTKGKLILTFDEKQNITDLILFLNEQQCGFKKINKKVSDVVILEVDENLK